MFLLKPVKQNQAGVDLFFTFHNVSIKTSIPDDTMMRIEVFTFHNVSIKTYFRKKMELVQITLHSIMFLLKPSEVRQSTPLFCLYIP